METQQTRKSPNWRKKYEEDQKALGRVKVNFWVDGEDYESFLTMAEAFAEEYAKPYDVKRRVAKAKLELFKKNIVGKTHDFFIQRDKIQSLKAQIRALTPNFFKTDDADRIPLPDAIKALPDDPKTLKLLLAKIFRDRQKLKILSTELQRRLDRYQDPSLIYHDDVDN